MTGYGIAGPHLGDDHSLDDHDGYDDAYERYIDSLLDHADDLRKGEA